MSKSLKKQQSRRRHRKQTRATTPPESQAAETAKTRLKPSVSAALTLCTLFNGKFSDAEFLAVIGELMNEGALANSGDLSRMEAMMTAQAYTLDALFNWLTRTALPVKHLNQFDTYMKIALRAQSQCRATVEALAEMKNPKSVAFVRQANIANGPQQVNNGATPSTELARAGENQNGPNKLLEDLPHEWLDTGAKSSAGKTDSSLETVEAVVRTEDSRR